jgi:hypothetical protein
MTMLHPSLEASIILRSIIPHLSSFAMIQVLAPLSQVLVTVDGFLKASALPDAIFKITRVNISISVVERTMPVSLIVGPGSNVDRGVLPLLDSKSFPYHFGF